MKKILFACAIAAMSMGAMTSCDKASEGSDNFADSVANAYGELNGNMLVNYLNNIPEEQKANMSKDDLLRGIKDVIMLNDSTDAGYMTGLQIGMELHNVISQIEANSGVKLNRKVVYEALVNGAKADSVPQEKLMMLQGQFQILMQRVDQMAQAHMQAKMEAEAKAKAESPEAKANAEAGKKYLADLKAKDKDVKETADGLMYKVVKEGTGESPAAGSNVKVIYTGKLIDGTEFDSSNGQPVEMNLDQLIPGFSEGVKLMKKGGKYTLYIPAELAYGPNGQGPIPAMSTLVFDIELVDFGPAAEAPARQPQR